MSDFHLIPETFTLHLPDDVVLSADGRSMELKLERAQDLCAVLQTALAPTLEPGPEKSTEEAPPLIPPTLTSATTMEDTTTGNMPAI